MRNIFLAITLLLVLVASGCDNKTSDKQAAEQAGAVTDSTQTLAYICPMKCEGSGSNEPGKCKVCDMDLVKNPAHQDQTTATDTTTRRL